jgi:hypothetical protein
LKNRRFPGEAVARLVQQKQYAKATALMQSLLHRGLLCHSFWAPMDQRRMSAQKCLDLLMLYPHRTPPLAASIAL